MTDKLEAVRESFSETRVFRVSAAIIATLIKIHLIKKKLFDCNSVKKNVSESQHMNCRNVKQGNVE